MKAFVGFAPFQFEGFLRESPAQPLAVSAGQRGVRPPEAFRAGKDDAKGP